MSLSVILRSLEVDMSEWISCEDKEPPLDTMVVIGWDDYPDIEPEMDYMTLDEDLNQIWANYYDDPPSHFMVIPKLVKK